MADRTGYFIVIIIHFVSFHFSCLTDRIPFALIHIKGDYWKGFIHENVISSFHISIPHNIHNARMHIPQNI